MCNAGVYQDGDCCTAIEVLRIFLDLSEKYPNKNFCIWCNDNDPEKIGILKRVLNIFPRNSRIQVFISQTDVNEYLDMLHYDSDLAKDIFKYGTATILYIDPFDFGTVEIPKVSIVLQNRYCELIFNFFISDYVRNIHQDAGRITKCLGGRRINTKNELITYMRTQLRVGYVKYLFSYQFKTKNNVELYQIVFATPSSKGLEKLKEALWEVFNGAEFHRNHIEDGQIRLLTSKDDEQLSLCSYANEAQNMLCERYIDQTVTWSNLELFLIEHTMLKESQIIRYVLQPLIESGQVTKCNRCGKRNYKEDSYTFCSRRS